MAPKFEISPMPPGSSGGALRAGNGEPIAASQVYETKDSAKEGIASVQAHARRTGRRPGRSP
ncbi:YegP family protein [Nocardia cyriacigeorgica]|uniref:YegP family protein n=1 Tax=Nocardia cyriacigeorgica TaxID=135487 RepID=UPI000CEA3F74|nr:DUF1508 domain-containing protein [Nocardia cyriacigeorgica]